MTPLVSIQRDIRLAYKNLFYNFGRYICFFILLFLIQSLFSTVLLLQYNHNTSQKSYLEEQYTYQKADGTSGEVYHLVLQSLSETQYATLRQWEERQTESTQYFKIVGGYYTTGELTTGTTYRIYDLYIQFTGDTVSDDYQLFQNSYYSILEEDGEFTEFVTPLLQYTVDLAWNIVKGVLFLVLIFLCATLMLLVLHSATVSHYQFTYGIYRTYGAGFGRLFWTAFWEMVLMNLFLFLPSSLLACLTSYWIFLRTDLGFTIWIFGLFLSLILTLLASLVAVWIDFKKLCSADPVRLIAAANNTGYISSPRIGSDFSIFHFPKDLEILSFKRFRKYVGRLLAFSLLFACLSTGCFYLLSIYQQMLDTPLPQYRLTFAATVTEKEVTTVEINDLGEEITSTQTVTETSYAYSYDQELAAELMAYEGVEAVEKSCATSASDIGTFLLVDRKKVKKSAGGVSLDENTALLNFQFEVLDEDIVSLFDYYGYTVSGNLEDVLNNADQIAITDSVNNQKSLKLKVGDTVKIAVPTDLSGVRAVYDENGILDSDQYLLRLIQNGSFTYRIYTIGAVISGIPSDSSFSIYLSGSSYRQITGNEPLFTDVSIILSDQMTDAEMNRLAVSLRSLTDYYTNMTFTDLDARFSKSLEENKNYTASFIYFALVLLAVFPLIWILFQSLFYRNREKEMEVYLSIGMDRQRLKKIFQTDAILYTTFATVLYVILAFATTKFINWMVNKPTLFRLLISSDRVYRFPYSFPWLSMLLSFLIVAISGLVSVWLPYRHFLKECHPIFIGESMKTNKKIKETKETNS